MDRYRVETQADRPYLHVFTPAEAEAFMRSWFRVVAPDGSTVAFCPDAATARRVVAAMERP